MSDLLKKYVRIEKAKAPKFDAFAFYGDNRTRTCDPLHVKQMLSQLSYISMATIISDKMGFGKLFLKREKQKKKVHEKFIVNYWKGMIL